MSLTLSLRRSGAILLAGAAACLVAGPASAADTPPACPVTDAPSNAVAITSTPLPVEALGGHYRTDTGWPAPGRSEEHTSELQSLMRISYAVFCLKKKKK